VSARASTGRALLYVAGVLVLTSIHHVYGALRYATPWRYHAVILAAVTLAVLLVAYRRDRTRAGRLAGRTFWVVSWVVPVLFIGGYEGLYNHVAKNVLYFGGLSRSWMVTLFPPPTYEMPNDLVFEITGVLQVVPAALAARHLLAAIRPDGR
jgi:hypothetical protein